MGKEVARGEGSGDLVNVPHGPPKDDKGNCPTPQGSVPYTEQCSKTVLVETFGAVYEGAVMKQHKDKKGCVIHAPPLEEGSGTVFVHNKGIARKGDQYKESVAEVITSVNQSTVFAGG